MTTPRAELSGLEEGVGWWRERPKTQTTPVQKFVAEGRFLLDK
jgi:hypothetical protein